MRENPLRLLLDARGARRGGPAEIAQRQRARLAGMVAHARATSPYYRELYRDLPERVEDPRLLPVISKEALMARFDDWSADRGVTIEKVRSFVADTDLIGERFLGRYLVTTTSGTTGTRGIFLVDDRAAAVRNALLALAAFGRLGAGGLAKVFAGGGRMAAGIATGGHFAGLAGAMGSLRGGRLRGRLIRVCSVHTPLPGLAAELDRFRPAVLTGYAGTILLLAGEQEAGRLRIAPALVMPAAEGLDAAGYARISAAFGATVLNTYAASECLHIAHGCAHGWLHVNSDWAVLEPVGADHRPVPPGEQSHTVLLTNLANRVQPILRYDLGDSVLMRPDPCPCGSPLPAIRVQGRVADLLVFPTDRGGRVAIPPLAFGSLVDRTPGVELFQILQTAPATLRVRLRTAAGADPEVVWRAVRDGIPRLLAGHDLGHVTVERAAEPPEQSPGGKYRAIVPLD